MRLAAIAFACGGLGVQSAPRLAAWGELAALALGFAVLVLATWFVRGAPRIGLVAAAAFVAGIGWSTLLAHHRLDATLPAELEGLDIVVTGVVTDLPQPFERGVRFEFDVESASRGPLSGRIVLAWYNGWTQEEFQFVQPIRAGERWRFTVRLRRPHGNANPHGFDYEAWLLERGIRATGSVRPRGEALRVAALAARPDAWIARLRERIRERFWEALEGARHGGVLTALAIGDQRAIRDQDWTTFNRTGVGHLMSISGLHVTMIAALGAWAIGWLWRRSTWLMYMLPTPKASALGGLAIGIGYCLLAGFGVPAQRTLYMLSVAAIALLLDRTQSASRVLAAALFVVVLLDPWAVLAPGFWLSFGAVAILLFVAADAHTDGVIAAWTRAQIAITVGLMPMTLALFQQISLVSPLANAVAIPIVSLVVAPLALLAAVIPIDALALIAHALVVALMWPLEALAALPGAVWQQHAPIGWTIALAALGAIWLLAPRGMPARFAALPLFAPMFLVVPHGPMPGVAWVDVLDVGQGLATAVRTANHLLVYDTGPQYGAETDAGNRVVVPFLRGGGARGVDRMIVSHLDTDHSGGAQSIAAVLPVGILASSVAPDSPLQAIAPYRLPCLRGQRWQWDGVRFEVLHPTPETYAAVGMKTNEMSCVVRVEAGGRSILLTGDIERGAEQALLRHDPGALRSDVVLVPHHGSRTSSTEPFIDAVAPAIAIVPVGYRNRFGHPRTDVIDRYRRRDIRVLRTDASGAIRVELGANGVTVREFRKEHPRYWR